MSRGDILSISAISAQGDIGKIFLDIIDFGSPPTGSGEEHVDYYSMRIKAQVAIK
jgi:hypothetical protein